MDLQTMIRIAKASAQAYKIDPALVCAVCEHESGGWNPWAIRFEPAFFDRYVVPMHLNPTEGYARAFSYGLMQVMGQTAREFGFKDRYLTELCDPLVGVDYGCKKLSHCLEISKGDIRAALLKYNGGSNLQYPDLVLPLMEKYQ